MVPASALHVVVLGLTLTIIVGELATLLVRTMQNRSVSATRSSDRADRHLVAPSGRGAASEKSSNASDRRRFKLGRSPMAF